MEKPCAGAVSIPEAYDSERIASMYQELAIPAETIRNIRRYFEAASHLYGIISLKHLLHIYNNQNAPVSSKEFLAIADIIQHEANDFCVLGMDALYEDAPATDPLNREVVSLLILSFGLEKYYELSGLQAKKAYAVLPKEQFLSYLNPGFYPLTPENLNMLAFLRNHCSCKHQSARDLLRTIQTMIWIGYDVQDVIQGLGTAGFFFENRAERRAFKVLFHAMERHTRTIANRGQTRAAISRHRRVFFITHRRLFSGFISAAPKCTLY